MVVLVGNQPAGYLGVCLGWEHGLGPFTRISAPDAAYVERRTATITLQRTVTFLSEKCFYMDSLFVFLFVERNAGYHVALGLGNFFHIVIEARYGDTSLCVRHLADYLAKHIDGVGNSTAEVTAVQVAVGAGHFYFPIGQSAQSGGQ